MEIKLSENGKGKAKTTGFSSLDAVAAQKKVGQNELGDQGPQAVLRHTIIESEARFRNLIQQAANPICILKGEYMILELANEAVFKVWNVGKEALGKPFLEIVPEMKDQPFMELLLDVYKNGATHYGNEVPSFFIRADGEKETMYFNFFYQPYREENGSISGVIVFANDVSQQVLAQKSMDQNEKNFRLMADLLPIKVGVANSNGAPTYNNQKWLDYTGLSLEELNEGQWERVVHSDDMPLLNNSWEQSIATGADFEIELRLLNKAGKYNWHLNSVKAVKGDNGRINLWIGATTEIQHQKKQSEELEAQVKLRTHEFEEANRALQQKNRELQMTREKLLSEYARSLIEASLDPLITISSEGKITDMNKAFAKATGMTRKQLTNTDFFKYFTDPNKAREVYREVFAKGFVVNYPLTIKDHTLTEVLFNGSVYKDEQGKVLGAVVVARDITERAIIEKELTEAKVLAELATLIAEEAKSKAEGATQIAESAMKSKQQFLSNMSHEIRTPMNAIIGFTKVLLKTELSAKQKEYLGAIKMSGNALIVLINDILDLAKVDAGKMTFEQTPFKMALSISAMLHLFETKVQEKNLVLLKVYDPNIPEVLVGDPVRLHQIILNLVSNAVKFTTTGKITVSARLLKEEEEKVTIEFAITDTGIGIPESEIHHIFENFQQASSGTSRLYGGTGLGLAIVKQLVETQGGTISVKSKVDEGSTFSFTLDFKKTNAEAALETTLIELDTEIKNIKVLVVEDMALNQLLMKTILDDFGFEREIAENGKIAVEKLKNKSYDIVLMDLQMPEMNGFEATEYIRNTLKSKIPIIALTADVTTADLAKCKAVGMNDYIAKPIDERILYSKIIGLVKKPVPMKIDKSEETDQLKKMKCTNLSYLMQRTKSNSTLMMEMIAAYLEQTPPLILAMKQSFQNKDWDALHAAVHKMIPSFLIMGIGTDFESMAKKIQEYARSQQEADSMPDFVLQIENVCLQACKELEEEFNALKKTKS